MTAAIKSVVWLQPSQLGKLYGRERHAIALWARTGFLLSLGFIVARDPKNQLWIGVPSDHEVYRDAVQLFSSSYRPPAILHPHDVSNPPSLSGSEQR